MKAALIMILLAAGAMAQQVRVTVRVIEVPHQELTKWTGEKLRGPELHDRALKLALAGGAEIVVTNVLVARSGEKALIESMAEMLSPTEYEPSSMGMPQPPLDSKPVFPPLLRPWELSSFETRNAGTTVEIEPTVHRERRLVDLRLAYEMEDRAALETWMEFRDEWGDASVKRPIFDTRRLTSAITLASGSFELLNVFTPKPAAVPAAATRQLVFVGAEILPIPQP